MGQIASSYPQKQRNEYFYCYYFRSFGLFSESIPPSRFDVYDNKGIHIWCVFPQNGEWALSLHFCLFAWQNGFAKCQTLLACHTSWVWVCEIFVSRIKTLLMVSVCSRFRLIKIWQKIIQNEYSRKFSRLCSLGQCLPYVNVPYLLGIFAQA